MNEPRFKVLRNWMYRNARPLELTRWRYLFESGSKEEVIKCLKAFQNSDGGFGHGIEPDFWNPSSTPMASWAAAQILYEISAGAEDEIVRRLIQYLLGTVDYETGMWPSTVQKNNQHPHAPWWQWSEDAQANWMYNPSAELSAYLIHWSTSREVREIGWKILGKGIERLMKADEMDRHELNNFKYAVEILHSNISEFNEMMPCSFEIVERKVWRLIEGCINQDYTSWGKDYQPLPLDFINHPNELKKFGHLEIEALVEHNLHFFSTSFNEEGVWDITWEWDQFADEFAVTRRIWKGILITNRCKILNTFHRISIGNHRAEF